MPSPTPNKGYAYPAHGGAVNAWDTPLDQNFDQIDLNLAGVYPITLSSTIAAVTYNASGATAPSTVTTLTPPSSIAQNLYYLVSGTIGANLTINFPAVGGLYVINNNSSGAFTVNAANSGGGTTVAIAQGGTTIVVSEGTSNMDQANSNNIARLYTYFGDPNGIVSGQQATANGGVTDFIWDVTNKRLNASNGGTAYQVVAPSLPSFQTYISPSNGTPIITGNVTSSAVYLNRYIGAWVTVPTSDGAAYYPYQLSGDLKLLLTNVAATDIVDIYLTQLSSTGPFLGTSPSWSVGGGSVTAGGCTRGVGAGSAQLSRATQGFYVNTNAMTLTNGTTGVAGILPGAAVLLGSVWTASAGAVTCHRAYGQNRKWGISNIYNKQPVFLKAGDPTSSWAYNSTVIRVSNNSTGNSLTTFSALAEETYDISFTQNVGGNNSNCAATIGIGYNATNSFTGVSGAFFRASGQSSAQTSNVQSRYLSAPSIGINTIYSVEQSTTGNLPFFGTESNMMLSAQWIA